MSSNKAGSRNQHPGRSFADESDQSPKPLVGTLLQEFQNLKDKFKNEDGEEIKGASIMMCSINLNNLILK